MAQEPGHCTQGLEALELPDLCLWEPKAAGSPQQRLWARVEALGPWGQVARFRATLGPSSEDTTIRLGCMPAGQAQGLWLWTLPQP